MSDIIEESTVYQDIWQKGYNFGKQEGYQAGILAGAQEYLLRRLVQRFDALSPAVRKRIGQLPLEKVGELSEAFLDFTEQKQVLAWLRAYHRKKL